MSAALFIFKAPISITKFLEPKLTCIVIDNFLAEYLVDILSSFYCLMSHFELLE